MCLLLLKLHTTYFHADGRFNTKIKPQKCHTLLGNVHLVTGFSFLFQKTLIYLLIFVILKERQRSLIHCFTPRNICNSQDWTKPMAQELNSGIPCRYQRSTCCCPGSATAGSWSQKQSWDLNPGTQTEDADVASNIFTTRLTIFPNSHL